MKKTIYTLTAIFCITLFTQCAKDGCTNVDATNFDLKADNDDGTCTFQATSFVGTYNVTGIKVGQTFNDTTIQNYQFIVTQTDGINISISNLGNTSLTMVGTIKNGQLAITKQKPANSNQLNYYEGSGVCNGNTINLQYTADFNNEFFNEVAVKQ